MSDNVKNQFSRFFDPVNNIIVNENLLNSRYVPNTVIARDEQMEKMGHYLSPILRQGEPSNMYIWGDTGVGKTITVKYLLRVLTEGLKSEGKDILIDTVVIDCTAFSFEISACVEILTQLSGISIPFGRQFYQYLNDIWQIIERKASEHSFYTLILFFDEIDAFTEPNNILYQFSRALAHQNIKSSNVAIEIIIASNQKDFLDTLNGKVLSSAAFRFIDFPDYNARELCEILMLRKEAFAAGVIADEVIKYCAENVADRYHGDARRAIDILAEAARNVIKNKGSEIASKDIDLAEKAVNDRATTEMLSKISLHDKYLILAVHIANSVVRQTNSKLPAQSGAVVVAYQKICDLLKQKPNGETYISARLTTLAQRQLINAEYREGKGNIRYITISNDIEAIINNLFQIQDLETIKNNFADIESIILTKLKRQAVKTPKLDFF
ncbi:MAG: AAA family ATPase [Alphaproteobacteria bacterium]|nr:MAG: AAA family ATPase [Alphaproteobacteria bacterium]